MDLNALDYVFLFILLGGFFEGFIRGMAYELLSLAVLLLSFFLAFRYYPQGAAWLREYTPLGELAFPISFVVVLVLFAGWLGWAKKIILQIFQVSFLKGLDRLLGGLFGLAGTLLVCLLLTHLLSFQPNVFGLPSLVKGSFFYGRFQRLLFILGEPMEELWQVYRGKGGLFV